MTILKASLFNDPPPKKKKNPVFLVACCACITDIEGKEFFSFYSTLFHLFRVILYWKIQIHEAAEIMIKMNTTRACSQPGRSIPYQIAFGILFLTCKHVYAIQGKKLLEEKW